MKKVTREEIHGDPCAMFDTSELESLQEEMETWRDNLSGTALENTEKFQTVSECADTLADGVQSIQDGIEELEGFLDGLEVEGLHADEKFTMTKLPPKAGRFKRFDRAVSLLAAVLDTIEQRLREAHDALYQEPNPEGAGSEIIENEKNQERLDALEAAAEKAAEVRDIVEGLEPDFPGMY